MEKTNIFKVTVDHFLKPILPFLQEPDVAEIMINDYDEIYVERKGQLEKTDAKFTDAEALRSAINNVLQYTGKRLDPQSPIVDSRLPDGSRVHVIMPPLCRTGMCVTIRKFAKVMFDAAGLIEAGSWTAEAMEYLQACVRAEKNILVAGGTSSGKTCLLNVLSGFIPPHQRIVVIEDSSELRLQQDHVVGLEARHPDRWGKGEVTISDLFRSSLRLRPDRIIIGEVRGPEALDVIQAMTSGHAGSMTTLHANMARDALSRLETLAMSAKIELPLYALRAQIASAIDVVVQMTRFTDGRRGLTEVAEVLPLNDDGGYQLAEMFKYELTDSPAKDGPAGELVWSGKTSTFAGGAKMRTVCADLKLTKNLFSVDS